MAAIEVKHTVLVLKDEIVSIGTGHRPVLYWAAGKHVYIYWHPDMTVYRVEGRLWNLIAKTEVPDYDIKSRARAIESNRSKAITNGQWNGGKLVELMLKAIAGKPVDELEITALQSSEETMAYPPDVKGPFEAGATCTLKHDTDYKGIIVRSGPEVSTVRQEGDKAEQHIPNGQIVMVNRVDGREQAKVNEKAAKETKRAEAKAEKEAARAKAREEKAAAKAAAKALTQTESETDVAKKAKKAAKGGTKKAAAKKPANGAARATKYDKVRFVVTGENARSKGSGGFKRIDALHKSIKSKPSETGAYHMKTSGARSDDIKWEVDRKRLKIVSAGA
jgi:hypothetical protein